MDNKTWLAEVSRISNIPRYTHNLFGDKNGALIGTRDAYIVALGLGTTEGSSAVQLLLRFGAADPTRVEEVLKPAKGKFENPVADANTAVAAWKYSFGNKPKPSDVAEATDRLLQALKSVAPPIPGKCERCQRTELQVTLFNGVPGYHCPSCQEQIRQELDAAAMQYESLETNLPLGLLYGTAGALIGSLAWGLVAYAVNRIFLYGAILIGFLVAMAVVKGVGKVNLAGRIMIGVLTIASVLFGDIIFYTLVIMKEKNLPFSFELIRVIIDNFWTIESESKGGAASIFFALIGAAVVMYRTRKPGFKARFEPLGTAAPDGQAQAAAGGSV